jgi:hypothetical protein
MLQQVPGIGFDNMVFRDRRFPGFGGRFLVFRWSRLVVVAPRLFVTTPGQSIAYGLRDGSPAGLRLSDCVFYAAH